MTALRDHLTLRRLTTMQPNLARAVEAARRATCPCPVCVAKREGRSVSLIDLLRRANAEADPGDVAACGPGKAH
jgi:hypothetical protein